MSRDFLHDKIPISGIECRPDLLLIIYYWEKYFEISGRRVGGYVEVESLERGIDCILCFESK